MALIQCRVARGHNQRRQVLGRLWQSRYKARLVNDDSYFKQLLPYVHLNPVTAGLVDDPAVHEWIGHSALIGNRPPKLADCRAALRGSGETPLDARKAYLEQVQIVSVHHLGHLVADVAAMLEKQPGLISRWLETSRCITDRISQVAKVLALIPGFDESLTRM